MNLKKHPALIRLGEEVEEVKPPMASPTERRASKMALVPIGALVGDGCLHCLGEVSIVFFFSSFFGTGSCFTSPRPQICMMNLLRIVIPSDSSSEWRPNQLLQMLSIVYNSPSGMSWHCRSREFPVSGTDAKVGKSKFGFIISWNILQKLTLGSRVQVCQVFLLQQNQKSSETPNALR